jgi:hypothetical protein
VEVCQRVFKREFDFWGIHEVIVRLAFAHDGAFAVSIHIDSPPPAHHFVSIFWKPRFVATTHRFAAMLHSLDHEAKGEASP